MAMTDGATEFFERVASLRRDGQAFAVATVVARRPPVSAHLGDRAIVFADGRMDGFVGGACAREIVRQQALDALRTRAPRLVSIRPDAAEPEEPSAERVVVPMSCASEGAVVVASQGHDDEEALEAALRVGAPYIGLVASRKRGATVRALLQAAGAQGVDDIRIPAGLDVGARTPPEVALSILAEIVQLSPSVAAPDRTPDSGLRTAGGPQAAPVTPTTAVDPVCAMQVEIAGARHTAEVDGVTYYFCCGGCRAAFMKQPQQFLSQPS